MTTKINQEQFKYFYWNLKPVIDYKIKILKLSIRRKNVSSIFNAPIKTENLSPKAYNFIINVASAIEWIMERYQVKTDKKSGITNNPNVWSEGVGNPMYILDLLLSVINVIMQTLEGLPKFKFQ